MPTKLNAIFNNFDRPTQYTREVLVEQILWLIRMRWIAVGGIVAAVLAGSYVFHHPLLPNATPIYVCAGILLLCNIFYLCVVTKKTADVGPKDVVLAMVQVGADAKLWKKDSNISKKDLISGNHHQEDFNNSAEAIKEANA